MLYRQGKFIFQRGFFTIQEDTFIMIPKNVQNVKKFHDPLFKIGRRAHQARHTRYTAMKNTVFCFILQRGVLT